MSVSSFNAIYTEHTAQAQALNSPLQQFCSRVKHGMTWIKTGHVTDVAVNLEGTGTRTISCISFT